MFSRVGSRAVGSFARRAAVNLSKLTGTGSTAIARPVVTLRQTGMKIRPTLAPTSMKTPSAGVAACRKSMSSSSYTPLQSISHSVRLRASTTNTPRSVRTVTRGFAPALLSTVPMTRPILVLVRDCGSRRLIADIPPSSVRRTPVVIVRG